MLALKEPTIIDKSELSAARDSQTSSGFLLGLQRCPMLRINVLPCAFEHGALTPIKLEIRFKRVLTGIPYTLSLGHE